MTERLGVGIVGCGQAAQAIHLPALASLPEMFRIAHCADADPDVARAVAERTGATASTGLDALLADASVDVVCIASPNHLHARQVVESCRAGKRGVLVEKPFAITAAEARAVAGAAREHGTAVALDTMHAYDPAWRAAMQGWGNLPSRALIARATTIVGSNETFVGAQTQPAEAARRPMDLDQVFTDLAAVLSIVGPDAPRRTAALWGWLLGLASHDLPLIRLALGEVDEVLHAALVDGFAYDVLMRAGRTSVHLTAAYLDFPRVDWSFELIARDEQVRVEFPPSFLSGASTRAVRYDRDGTHELPRVHETGYRAAWRDLHRAVTTGAPPLYGPEDAAADLELAERILRVAAGMPERRPVADGPPVVCLGAGVWSGVHLGLVAQRSPVVRVASRTIGSATARAMPFGAEATTFDAPGLLDGAGAAIVVGVPATHAAHTVAALESGIPVLVEKPLARTVAEARRVAEAARRTGTRCVYAENWAYQPAVRAALAALAGRTPATVRVTALWPRPGWGSFLDPEYGGGVLFDAGVHPIELARLLLGRPPAEWVEAELRPGDDVAADLEANVVIGFAGGRVAEVRATWTAPAMSVVAEGDGFRLELSPAEALVVDGAAVALPRFRTVAGALEGAGYRAQIDALLGNAQVLAGPEDGLAVMEIVAAAYRSAGTGRRQPLPFAGDLNASPHVLWRG